MKRWSFLLLLAVLMVVLTACGGNADDDNTNSQDNADQENTDSEDNDQGEDAQKLEVDLQNQDDESVGTATLDETADGVEVSLEGENLPKGMHAFHIHEKGQCEAPDFESAGDHFNPDDTDHGFDESDGPHAGDMPNIAVGDDGKVKQSFLLENVTLEEGEEQSLLGDDGTSLVIHEGADDGKSQPAGDAGDRLACGPIDNKHTEEQ